jgi:hypothetical protein
LHVAFVKRPSAHGATLRRTNALNFTIGENLLDKAKLCWRCAVAAQHRIH